MMTCSECNGRGKVLYTCCGENIMGTIHEDYRRCPDCQESVGDPEICEACNGTGFEDTSSPDDEEWQECHKYASLFKNHRP